MIYIDLINNPPSNDWITKAEALTEQLMNAEDLEARKIIIEANSNLWTEIKEHYSNIRNRKCWYSESINDGSHCHVDHFRPKIKALDENGIDHGGYWWLSFDWLNYRFSGPAPNVRKKDYFPVLQNKAQSSLDNTALEDILLLDPVNVSDPSKLAYDEEGKVIPKSTIKTSRDYRRASYSIQRYNLNMEGLKEGRRQKVRRAGVLIKYSHRLISLQNLSYDIPRENEIVQYWRELKLMSEPAAEYSATVRFLLNSCGYDWARDLLTA